MKKRDPYFDNVKILLMVFVVLGHVLPIDLNDKINRVTFGWIFSFHMPLFVFISGYFTRITDKKKYFKGILSFAETLFVFTLLGVIILYLQGKPINTYELLIQPRWTLWYLWSLILWRLILYFTPVTIRDNHKMLIIISVVICLAMGWVPIEKPFSFQRTFAYLPFFITGFVAGEEKRIIKKHKRIFPIIFLLVVALILFIIPKCGFTVLYQRNCYFHNGSFSPFIYFCCRAGWLVLANCMSYCFLSLVPRKEYRLTHFGQLTLFIYMYHFIILSWRYTLRDGLNLPTNMFWCVIYTVIILGIVWIMSKIKFFHWLLNPITSLINKR